MICVSCNIDKLLSEFSFRKDSNKYRTRCKECRRLHSRKWWAETKSSRNAKQKQHYLNNREVLLEKQNQYSKKNRLQESIRAKEWRKNNPMRVIALNQSYYSLNRDALLRYGREYAKNNPEVIKHNRRKRKSRLRNAPVNDLTKDQWIDILINYNHLCAYCGSESEDMTMDHAIPISRGGNHTASNVVPACFRCNCSKGNKTPGEFTLWKADRDFALSSAAHCQTN